MKLTAAVLALLAVTLSAAPAMASVADVAGWNVGVKPHHHHHRKHHHAVNDASGGAAAHADTLV